jgi:hypothetical protein
MQIFVIFVYKLIWKFQVQENNLVHLFEVMTNASVLSEIKATFGAHIRPILVVKFNGTVQIRFLFC